MPSEFCNNYMYFRFLSQKNMVPALTQCITCIIPFLVNPTRTVLS